MESKILFAIVFTFFASPLAFSNEIIISKEGKDYLYIEKIVPGTEGISDDVKAISMAYGTYDDLQKSVSVIQGKSFIGKVITINENICTETITKFEQPIPAENPQVITNKRIVPCP